MFKTFIRRLFSGSAAGLLKPGLPAPAFRVHDHRGELLNSADLAGQRYVLWFYPKAGTGG